MKKLTGLLISICLTVLFCFSKNPDNQSSHFENQYVSIDFDTTYVDCDLNLGSMIRLNNTYYIFSERVIDMAHFTDQTNKLYLFSNDGQKLFETDVSEIFNSYYYLQPQNDTLIAIIGSRTRTLCFDPVKLTWQPIQCIEPALFEDNGYSVTSTCSGEWGGTIYFKDKHTGIIYEGSSTCPVKVNRYDGKYYVSNYLGHMFGHLTLYEIEDPRNMSVYTGRRPQEDENIDQRECPSTQGMTKKMDILGYFGKPEYDSVLKTSLSRSRCVELLSSFVRNNRLLHLYSDGDDVFICKLKNCDSVINHVKNKEITNVYQFKTKMENNPWIKFNRTDYHQLHFRTDRKDLHIIMEITPSRILVHHIINKSSSPKSL